MIIYNKKGVCLYKSSARTIKKTLEQAVSDNIYLGDADLCGANLRYGSFDGIQAPGACFLGADLTGADLGLSDLRTCNFQEAEMIDTCLAESDLSGSDMRKAYFSGTILEGSCIKDISISCPSFWRCDFSGVLEFGPVHYENEETGKVVFDRPPFVIHGLQMPLMLADGLLFCGNRLYRHSNYPTRAHKDLMTLKAVINHLLRDPDSFFAKKPDRKIVCARLPS